MNNATDFSFSCGLTLAPVIVCSAVPLTMCYKVFIFIIFCFGKCFTECWLRTVANCHSGSRDSVETTNIDSVVVVAVNYPSLYKIDIVVVLKVPKCPNI